MFHVYILESEITGRHYVGHTSDLTQRLGQHNNGITKSTKNRGPWKLIRQENLPTSADAMRRERFLKTGQGRQELKRLLSVAPVAQLDRASGYERSQKRLTLRGLRAKTGLKNDLRLTHLLTP